MEDALLKDRILDAIEWETEVDVATTGVSVAEGIVRLFGCVGTAMERQVLEQVVQDVSGVAGITNDLDVRGWHSYRAAPPEGLPPAAHQPHGG
jgi:osmotically-inducible protein OsmY